MPAVHLVIARGIWHDHRDAILAVVTFVIAVALSQIVDRAIARRGSGIGAAMAGGRLTPVADTRLRLVRRLVVVGILVIGTALALSQFAGVRRMATGVLASSAVLGLVVGFAARQILANAVSGILLAITQPIRIGDLVTFEGTSGVVDDMKLTYTYLRAPDATMVIIPNERLAQTTIENHTLADSHASVEAELWLDPDADPAVALEALRTDAGVEAVVAAVDKDGVLIRLRTRVEDAGRREAAAAELRLQGLQRLREQRLSSGSEL